MIEWIYHLVVYRCVSSWNDNGRRELVESATRRGYPRIEARKYGSDRHPSPPDAAAPFLLSPRFVLCKGCSRKEGPSPNVI